MKIFSFAHYEDCEILPDRSSSGVLYDPLVAGTPEANKSLIKTVVKEGAIALTSCTIEFNCVGCNLCKPIRVAVKNFTPSTSQNKVIRKNKDLTFEVIPAQRTKELEGLFVKHHYSRFATDTFCAFFEEARYTLQENDLIAVIRNENNRILAAATLKASTTALVGIKRFFDPSLSNRSLGVFVDLNLIRYAQTENIDHLYLGAVNLESESLKHQARYSGSEVFNRVTREWVAIERNPVCLDHIP